MSDNFPDLSTSLNSQTAKDPARVSRRRFGQQAALLAVCSLSPGQVIALPHNPGPRNGGDLSQEQAVEVDAKLANIIRKHGNRLSDEQRIHLRRILSYNETMLASVRMFPLQNDDPPASVLKISSLNDPPKLVASQTQEGNR